jgi:hypothetical protein
VKATGTPTAGTTISNTVNSGTFDGKKAVIVSQSDGTKLYVAAIGTPYPLRIVSIASSTAGASDSTFSGFGKHVALKAPAGAVDVTKIITS